MSIKEKETHLILPEHDDDDDDDDDNDINLYFQRKKGAIRSLYILIYSNVP